MNPLTQPHFKQRTARKNTIDDDQISQTTAVSEKEQQKRLKRKLPEQRKSAVASTSAFKVANTNTNSVAGNKNSKGDKKNVVKNFVKAFRGFLCQWGDEEKVMQYAELPNKKRLEEYRQEWIEFEKSAKYNNRLIKQLLTNSKFQYTFVYFLQNSATEWLRDSGVVDKKSHSDVLKGYIKASYDISELEKIVCLKSRCQNDNKN